MYKRQAVRAQQSVDGIYKSVSVTSEANLIILPYFFAISFAVGTFKLKEAEVVWTLSTTRAQYNTGLREEVRRRCV